MSDREVQPIFQPLGNNPPAAFSASWVARRWRSTGWIGTNEPRLAALIPLAMFAFLLPGSIEGAVMSTRHYTTADGLARDSVHCIIKDKIGYLWFATGEGISRFDGYSFFNYRVTDGLPDRDVRSIVESDDGSFLVATGGGAARFNPYRSGQSSLFVSFLVEGGFKAQSVRKVIDALGSVWIGTDAGLFVATNGEPPLIA